ncbi:toxin-antitoxin system HicB family antitoxin [Dactylosporangium vinaceum]|uniref:Toxin-antitoxin system HicB family antitoxin n=1 Tax=Dactylosporangium vinaceum TaxID=53362 RepID=A0ABV5LYJ1_9ACTN|nr:toxin-antitoxin system HicB family antitoxin [Dactylosporangium vinaceum]UAB98227.1 toxin-antitoxin system HicB family antitoxin [Dactylosporangium vinaceum]
MDLTSYVEGLRAELLAAAGPEESALAERLAAAVASATRLAMLDALTDAADEITRDLAPGSVEVRVRDRNPYFVVTTAANEPAPAPPAEPEPAPDGPVGRINFRPPEQLKQRIEEAAARDGLSVNAWLTRTLNAALNAASAGAPAPAATAPRTGAKGTFVGWVG